MRRALVVLCACCGCGALSLGLVAGATGADSRLQANKSIARRDTRMLLDSLRLPSGSARTATRPPLPALVPPRVTDVHSANLSAWWTSSDTPAAVLAYVRAHPPVSRGYYSASWWDSGDILMWEIDGAHLYSQQLRVAVATLANGQTGIMAQAQSVWMVPRPLSERLPAGVGSVAARLRIGSGLGGMKHQHTHVYLLTHSTTVAAIVNAFNAMPISQPGIAYSCPAIFAGMPRLTLRFLSQGGATLARAQVNVYPGRHGASGWNSCDPIEFWIGTKSQTPLTSHAFVKRIAKLTGADFS